MESALNFKNSVLGEFSELQYSLSSSYQAARLLVYNGNSKSVYFCAEMSYSELSI